MIHLQTTHLKRPWCWERLRAGGEGDDRGWDGWMASPTWWTWVWVNSDSWWWTGRPGALRSMESQGVRHDWATELNWTRPHELVKNSLRLKKQVVRKVPSMLYIPAPTTPYRRLQRGVPTPHMKKFLRESFEELNLYLLEFGGTREW